jgi:hypothetical protein
MRDTVIYGCKLLVADRLPLLMHTASAVLLAHVRTGNCFARIEQT